MASGVEKHSVDGNSLVYYIGKGGEGRAPLGQLFGLLGVPVAHHAALFDEFTEVYLERGEFV